MSMKPFHNRANLCKRLQQLGEFKSIKMSCLKVVVLWSNIKTKPALQRQPSENSEDFALNQDASILNSKLTSLEPFSWNENAMNTIQPKKIVFLAPSQVKVQNIIRHVTITLGTMSKFGFIPYGTNTIETIINLDI
ncbi:hypothetical protein BpHYR1_048933 [Brachionus plicatilis]|uniref:Uncharacterized protein n=1 Tax=Brachionus plicatilis TaxID=10195 RepID=A0A3M7QRS3_BRAPC|nr:hypothetical protein BpHYR1_048933 [Brachionus plicatilis]